MGMTITTAIQSNQPFKRKAHLDHPELGTRWITLCDQSGRLKYLRPKNGLCNEYWELTANDLVAADYMLLNRPRVSIAVLDEVLGRHLNVDTKREAVKEILARFN